MAHSRKYLWQNFTTLFFYTRRKILYKRHSSCFSLLCLFFPSLGQCPPNIDFEQGTFNNWLCWTQNGYTRAPRPPLPPSDCRKTLICLQVSLVMDWIFTGFPKNCPNGSGHSIKIGEETTGQHVDRVSYTFTIPAGQNTYNFIYNYALVLNQGATTSHDQFTQPKFLVKAYNLTDGGIPLPCPFNGYCCYQCLARFPGISNTS